MTRGFVLESLNQEPQVAKLLAKLPDRAHRPLIAEHEESASVADQQSERTDTVTARLRDFAAAGEFRYCRTNVASLSHRSGGKSARSDNTA